METEQGDETEGAKRMTGTEAVQMWAALFIAGFLGHLVGDYIVQTSWQAANKARPLTKTEKRTISPNNPSLDPLCRPVYRVLNWEPLKAITGHALSWGAMVTLFTTLPAWIAFRSGAIIPTLQAGAILALIHWIQDRRWPVKWLMEKTGHDSSIVWLLIVTDNTLHLLQIAGAAAWIIWRVG